MKVRLLNLISKNMKSVAVLFFCSVVLAVVMLASVALAAFVFAGDLKTIRISDGSTLYELTADCDTVSEALSLAGIKIDENEVLNCKLDDDISKIDIIRVSSKVELGACVGSGFDTLVDFKIVEVSKEVNDGNISNSAGDDGISDSENKEDEDKSYLSSPDVGRLPEDDDIMSSFESDGNSETTVASTSEAEATPVPAPVVTLEYEDILEEIDFETKYVEDTSMLEGETRVAKKGEKGIITHVYEITMTDGVETSRRLVKDKNTKEPVDEIIAYGTISNFLNSRGQKVVFSKCVDAVATAYTYSEKWVDLLYWTNQLGGLRARWGVIAVDPNVIPLGTKVYVKSTNGTADYGFAIAADIGGSIKGNKVDLWMDNAEITFKWGRRDVEVYILEDQSVDVFALRGDSKWS